GMASIEDVSAAIAAVLDENPGGAAAVPARRRPLAPRTARARKAAQRRSARTPTRRARARLSGAVQPEAAGPVKARAKSGPRSGAKSGTKPETGSEPRSGQAAAAPGVGRRGKKSAKAGIKVVVKRGRGTPTKPDRPTGGKTRSGAKKRRR